MDSDTYARLEQHFQEARQLAGAERAAFLERLEAEEPELADQVRQLCTADAAPSVDVLAEGALDDYADPSGLEFQDETGYGFQMPEYVGPYRIVGQIGAGGMGVVFEAEQASPRRRVALKLVRSLLASQAIVQRFRREGEILGRLHHPGIAQIFEAGRFELGHGSLPYFAMEYVDGVDLSSYAAGKRLGRRQRVQLMAEVCEAVAHAHEKDIVHRDLKPDNVLVREDGTVKVLDFGLARALETGQDTFSTREGSVLGTLAYMPPESVSGDASAPSADVYSLGVMLYELLVGRRPFDVSGLTMTRALLVISQQEAPRIKSLDGSLAGDLDAIVTKATSKDPSRRYATAGGLAADLRRHLENLPVVARPPSRAYLARKYVRRNRALVITLIALALGTIVSGAFGIYASGKSAEADESRQRMRRTLYSAQMRLASEAAKNPAGVNALPELLDGWRVEAVGTADSEPDLRGWEWFFFDAYARKRFEEWPTEFPGLRMVPDPSGSTIVLENVGQAVLFDSSTRQARGRFLHGSDASFAATWSLDGTRPLLVHAVEALHVVDLEQGAELATVPLPTLAGEVALSPTGTVAAVADREKVLRLLDLGSHEVLWELRGASDYQPGGLCFSPDGRLLATGAADGALWLLRTDDGERVLHLPRAPENYQVFKIAWSPDGSHFAFSRAGRQVWVVASDPPRVVRILDAHMQRTTGVAFSPDGSLLATCSWGGDAALWDVKSGVELRRFSAGSSLESVAIVDDGKHLLAARGSGGLLTWDLRAPSAIAFGWTHDPAQGPGRGEFARSGDGAWTVTHNGRGLALWRTEDGLPRGLAEGVPGTHPALSRSGRYLALRQDGEGTWLRVYSVPRLTLVAEYELTDPSHTTFTWNPAREGHLTVIRGDAFPWHVDLEGSLDAVQISDPTIFEIAWDDARFCGYAQHGDAYLTRIDQSGHPLSERLELAQRIYITSLSPARDLLAVATTQGSIVLVETESMTELATIQAHRNTVVRLAWRPDGSRLASGDVDGEVVLCDPVRREPVASLKAGKEIRGLGWRADGSGLTAALVDGTLVEWRVVD